MTKTLSSVSGVTTVESRQRLSRSRLYDLQRTFYEREGTRAWGSGTVPHYITCNPMIAASYAEVVLGFLRDARAAGQLRPDTRVHVVEIGSGSGRFGYLFLRRLRQLLRASSLDDIDITLLLTDFNDGKFDEWRQHPSLAPLIAEGSVDLVVIDAANAGNDGTLTDDLRARIGDAPAVLIANYVLDSVPQDAFAIRHGTIDELLVTTELPGADVELDTPEQLADLAITWQPQTDTPLPYYGDAELDRIIDDYAATLDNTAVLLPTAAIELMRWFASLTDAPTLTLAADKGNLRATDLFASPEPGVALHGGCFSLMVNFDAIRRFVEHRGGLALHPPTRPSSLAVGAYVLGTRNAREMTAAFARHVVEQGPDDVFALRTAMTPAIGSMTIDQLLAYVRTYLADATVFFDCFARLLDLATDATEDVRQSIRRLVADVWDGYFPIGEATDLALCIGLLLSGIDDHREALPFFAESRRLHGPTATTWFAEAVARYALRDLEGALKCAHEALDLEPGFSGARRLKATIEDQA